MPTAYCANHPDLQAVARCKGCRKLLCNKCRVRGHDGWYCGKSCMSQQKSQQQQVQAHDDAGPKRSALMSKLPMLIVIAAVGGLLYWVFGMQGVRSLSDLRDLLP